MLRRFLESLKTTFSLTFKPDDLGKLDVNLVLVLVVDVDGDLEGTLDLDEPHVIREGTAEKRSRAKHINC